MELRVILRNRVDASDTRPVNARIQIFQRSVSKVQKSHTVWDWHWSFSHKRSLSYHFSIGSDLTQAVLQKETFDSLRCNQASLWIYLFIYFLVFLQTGWKNRKGRFVGAPNWKVEKELTLSKITFRNKSMSPELSSFSPTPMSFSSLYLFDFQVLCSGKLSSNFSLTSSRVQVW